MFGGVMSPKPLKSTDCWPSVCGGVLVSDTLETTSVYGAATACGCVVRMTRRPPLASVAVATFGGLAAPRERMVKCDASAVAGAIGLEKVTSTSVGDAATTLVTAG